jgi:ubiquinone/menaquinone biosynthesis C-methylase UbiE
LDVGAGVGLIDGEIAEEFGAVYGIDPSFEELMAASSNNPSVSYAAADGSVLPFADNAFDIVFASCVLHHLPLEQRLPFSRELARVTARGGLVIVIEHNPLNPLTRLAVHRCAFDEDAVLLRKGEVSHLLTAESLAVTDSEYVLFFPWRPQIFRRIETALRKLPVGAQHLTVARKN